MTLQPLWTVEAMAQALSAERAGARPASVGGISIDSRSILLGEAFFAIKGDSRDGHDFVAAALKGGAGLAVVSADRRGALRLDGISNPPLLVVPDVLEALRGLARPARARISAQVIAVTGSVRQHRPREAP